MNIVIFAVEACLILALVGVIAWRQVRGQYTDARSIWKAPLILTVVGLTMLPATAVGFRAIDALLLAIEVVVCVLIGLGMGKLTSTSVASAHDRRGRNIVIRTGWLGAALWVVFVAVRLMLRPVALTMHAEFVTSVGVTLLLVAIARATTALIVRPQIERAVPLSETSAKGAAQS
ncbi:hypothetical protein [Brevibacterium oceani]|uniref:hypothetical protein n=1 Tax=Brevibacterium oceani TaxID=358099 RepID=UPI0015E7BF9D|nr:hypothetical protein [Brevibacterium oceani]